MNTTHINKLSASLVLVYCKEKIFKSSKVPSIVIRKNKSKTDPTCKGYYNSESNTIVIFNKAHRSFIDFIDTIIHEYVHSTQCMEQYTKLFNKYGYDKHPYEHKANKIAYKHSILCKRYIKDFMK
jgi:hypothetical protein